MLTDKCLAILSQANRALQFTADRQNFRYVFVQKNRNRNKSTGAAKLLEFPVCDPHHRIVTTQQNLAIVNQEAVREAAQTHSGLIVAYDDWFFAEISAGHH